MDITDYFNFDLNEESWKTYCQNLVLLVIVVFFFVFTLPIYVSIIETIFSGPDQAAS